MILKRNTLGYLVKLGLCAVFALGLAAQTQADDAKSGPTGTWTWTMAGRNGRPDRKMSLKLKAEGDKLTGKFIAPGRGGNPNETEIKDGKVNGDEVSFTVERKFRDNTFTTKYHAKVTGDTLKGKVEFERNGETQTRDWEAKRASDSDAK